MVQNYYLDFLFNWFLEFITSIVGLTFLMTGGLLYIGLCSYINSMVMDIKARIANMPKYSKAKSVVTSNIDPNHSSLTIQLRKPAETIIIWLTYVKEIDFHVKIFE